MHWKRRGSEGGAPRKMRRVVALAKSRWMMGPRCSGELQECQLGKAAVGSGGLGMDDKRTSETKMGGRPVFLKSVSVARGREEKRGGRHGRVHVEAGEGGEGWPWHGGWQLRAPNNGPRPSGMGSAVAAQTEEGGGRWRRGQRGEHD
jgi:hypothetical protein